MQEVAGEMEVCSGEGAVGQLDQHGGWLVCDLEAHLQVISFT